MSHKCFISFKKEDLKYKLILQNEMMLDIIDKSLDVAIDSTDEDYVMQKIRDDYLSDSTVTIFLIGSKSSENLGWQEQRFIKREMQSSLYNGKGNTRNGILGLVLPEVESEIYKGTLTCSNCGKLHSIVKLNDDTVIREFWQNYYIPPNKCSWSDEERYCILTKWSTFIRTPNVFIEEAFEKRSSAVAGQVKVRP